MDGWIYKDISHQNYYKYIYDESITGERLPQNAENYRKLFRRREDNSQETKNSATSAEDNLASNRLPPSNEEIRSAATPATQNNADDEKQASSSGAVPETTKERLNGTNNSKTEPGPSTSRANDTTVSKTTRKRLNESISSETESQPSTSRARDAGIPPNTTRTRRLNERSSPESEPQPSTSETKRGAIPKNNRQKSNGVNSKTQIVRSNRRASIITNPSSLSPPFEPVEKKDTLVSFNSNQITCSTRLVKQRSDSVESTTSTQIRKQSSLDSASSQSLHFDIPGVVSRNDRLLQLHATYRAIASATPVRSSSSDSSRYCSKHNLKYRTYSHPILGSGDYLSDFASGSDWPPSPAPETAPRRPRVHFSRPLVRPTCLPTRPTRRRSGRVDSPSDSEPEAVPYDKYFSPGNQSGSVDQNSIEPRQEGSQPMGRMERTPLDDHERKIVIEFCHLLEKSKQLFNGLRELPQYGHKQWHSYFGRTFDVYTKLWKFQQQHRLLLDAKYGLKRWQIGEIASKIGQLYYHFYLRTSETRYLNEAFSFYYAIRGRCYYTKACKEDKSELVVKKLRYYARFIVVCLLLKKIKLVRELTKELDRQIVEYGNTYNPDDQIEWTVVVDEVKSFIQAEAVISVVHPDNYVVILSHRLGPLTVPPVEKTSLMNLSLEEALIVGSCSQQVKFSELTMDMFRMLQTLEKEPGEIHYLYDDSPRQRFASTPNAAPPNRGYRDLEIGPSTTRRDGRENPHKYLLFKPSPSQMLVYLSSSCSDLPPSGIILLYISAEGYIFPAKQTDEGGYDVGGLIITSKNDIYRDCKNDQKAPPTTKKEPQCLYPGDIYPFTRRPLFMIIDSDNSHVFQNMPRHFGQPLVIFMSPVELPSPFHERRQQGNLFTLFLHSPLTAICYCCDILTLSLGHWDRAQGIIDNFMMEASQALLTRSRIDPAYIIFMGDEFLRLLILRFIFCEITLRMHRAFRGRAHLTRCSPPLPEDIYEHPQLVHSIMDLIAHLQIRSHFHEPSSSGPPPPRDQPRDSSRD